MKKIVLIGCPSSGKTTLGREISTKYSIPILYLDKIFWITPKGISQEDFLKQQLEFMSSNPSWIIDGNFHNSTSLGLRLESANSIVVFDLPKIVVYWRFIKRLITTIGKKREDMPNGRKETPSTVWGLAKYIWSFNNEKIMNKVTELDVEDKVTIIKSLKSESEYYRNI